MQETWVWLPGQEDPLEKEMATHSSILACRIPWTEEPGGLQSMGHKSRTWLSDQTATATAQQWGWAWTQKQTQETSRKRVTCQNSRSSYLKCHPQPKTKDDVEGREIQFWVFTKKSKIRLLRRFKSLSSPLRSFRRFGHPPLPGTAKEMPLQMEISLTNGNVSYKNVNPTWFSESFTWLLFLRNKQLKIINMPKTHILGWRILFPYTFRSIVP